MKIFLDTEFTALSLKGELISLAMVDETGKIFYAEFTDYNSSLLTEWHQEHVIANLFLTNNTISRDKLPSGHYLTGDSEQIKAAILEWLPASGVIKFVADVGQYDWVFFCELFGGSLHLPSHISYMPLEFSTILEWKGYNSDTPREEFIEVDKWAKGLHLNKHNALYDCLLMKEIFAKVTAHTIL